METVDSTLVRAPFESLKRAAKERKSILVSVTEATSSMSRPSGNKTQTRSKEAHIQNLDSIISSLQIMKRKLADVSQTEKEEAGRCKARLEHLKSIGKPDRTKMVGWTKLRLNRILVDYMLRSGHRESAELLTRQADIKQLVDGGIFQHAWKVVEALRRHSCTEALQWCEENQSRLKRSNCNLEFKLRIQPQHLGTLQEFIELVRAERRVQALQYARQYLAPWAAQHMQELQRAVATLVFTPHTRSKYRSFFEEEQWQMLVELFLQELYKLNQLTSESLLLVHLQAGLSALNTPQAYESGSSKDDPLHLPAFQKLAEGLPLAKHVHSKLVCSLTKELMNDANPPMVLPNGYVYSARAVEMIMSHHDGQVVCPKTGTIYSADELRRAFIV